MFVTINYYQDSSVYIYKNMRSPGVHINVFYIYPFTSFFFFFDNANKRDIIIKIK